tara:strand:+ start:11203 stop:11484 length:282 start_codon:yes stop_codon:yes gene_type:complete
MKRLATIAAVIMLGTTAQANTNPIIDKVENAKDFAVNNKASQFVIQEYNEMKEFQTDSWQQGKEQLGRNKEQVIGIFTNVKDAFNHYFNKESQ